jgi:hypothetical protein
LDPFVDTTVAFIITTNNNDHTIADDFASSA